MTQEESSYFDNLVNNIKTTEDSTIKQQLKNELINKISAETPDTISINILAKNNNDKASKIIAQRTAIAQKEYVFVMIFDGEFDGFFLKIGDKFHRIFYGIFDFL